MTDRFIKITASQMNWLRIIPPAQHGLWLALHWFGGSDGKVWASRATLADMVGIGERTVSRGLRALENCRAITLEERNGQTSIIYLQQPLTLDTSVNPPLTDMSRVPLTDMTTPLDTSDKGPLTDMSTKEEKEDDKRKVLLFKTNKEEEPVPEPEQEMDWHCQQMFRLYERYADPEGPLGRKHWRCPKDGTFMDWYASLPIAPTEWHSNAWQRIVKSIDGWMHKQTGFQDGGRAWRYEYWQKGIVDWLGRNAPKKPSYDHKPSQPTSEQKAVHNSLSRADNEWLSMLALGMEQGAPSSEVRKAMANYPDDNFLKKIYQNKFGRC
jgi:hypothetical protein